MRKCFVLFLFLVGGLVMFTSCNKREKEAAILLKQQQIADSIAMQKNFEKNFKSFSDNPLVFLEGYFKKGTIRPLGNYSLQKISSGESFSYTTKANVTYFGILNNPAYLVCLNNTYYDAAGSFFKKPKFESSPQEIFNFSITEIPKELSVEWLDKVLPVWPLNLRIHYSNMKGCGVVENYHETYLLLHRVDSDVNYFEISTPNPYRQVEVNGKIVLLLSQDGSLWDIRK
jgi:hypothetical protein